MRPLKAIMARRACVISASLYLAFSSGSAQNFSGSRAKSPGSRSEPACAAAMPVPEMSSIMPTMVKRKPMLPESTMASCAAIELRPSYFAPGKWMPESTVMQPTIASIHKRPCLSSASLIQYMVGSGSAADCTAASGIICGSDFGSIDERPSGSKPTSPTRVPSQPAGCGRNGMAADLAPIETMPRVAERADGAKAVADAAQSASTMVRIIVLAGP
mmetsp:Transcript_11718/g.24684  ORF Transcript_11718/g.24684 Transcript_11718/m.24684 type:complete len:216 (+) Transcript_11718:285-932(+)